MNNKKQIRLTESDLKQIVKESVNKILNEAYGTMPQDDANFVGTLAYGDYPKDSIYGTIKGAARKMLYNVKNAKYTSDNSMNIYLDKIQNDLEHILKMVQPLKKLEIMQRGANPDLYHSGVGNGNYVGNGGGEQRDYSGLPGWGG